jgi:hypothetical protein
MKVDLTMDEVGGEHSSGCEILFKSSEFIDSDLFSLI